MDPGTGSIRELEKNEQPKGKEVLFQAGDELEIKGCRFKIVSIQPEPVNEMLLKGIPRNVSAEVDEALQPSP